MLDWLWNNPLGTMRGPGFLALYTIVIGAVIFGSRWLIRQSDETRSEPTPPVPESPDPYLVAGLAAARTRSPGSRCSICCSRAGSSRSKTRAPSAW